MMNYGDKANWGTGPWQDEVNELTWIDEPTELTCKAIRHPRLGHWCGYVAIDRNHAFYEKGYGDVDVSVHGGLTYADHSEPGIWNKVSRFWWFGFDCAHSGDKSPGSDARLANYGVMMREISDAFDRLQFSEHYWTLPEVQAECAELAAQLASK